MKNNMYSIGDKVIDKSGKVYLIDSEETKNFGNGDVIYFVLTPFYVDDMNKGSKRFIPKDKSETLLHSIMSRSEALKLIDSYNDIEVLPESNPRERKLQIQNVISTGDRLNVCRAIKTLACYRDERRKNNKPFSDFDNRLLTTLKSMLDDELSIALDIPRADVNQFVFNRTGVDL